MRRRQLVGLRGIDAQQQTALAAGADRHVAVDQEGQAAEHRSSRSRRLGRHQLADAVGESSS